MYNQTQIKPPEITGPEIGIIGEKYDCTVSTIDPQGNDVFYFIYWSDGVSGWLGPYPSGQEVTVSHTWSKNGTYTIGAIAKNSDEFDSEWGILNVSMKTPVEITIGGGFGVSAIIKNIGETTLTNINWSIALDGKLIFFGKTKSGTITSLAAGEFVTVRDFLIIGLGETGIAVKAEDVEVNATGTAFLFFVVGVT